MKLRLAKKIVQRRSRLYYNRPKLIAAFRRLGMHRYAFRIIGGAKLARDWTKNHPGVTVWEWLEQHSNVFREMSVANDQ